MTEENKPDITKKKFETIALSEQSTQKITNWLDQASQKKKGIKITRKDFVNWLIEKTSENLGSSDMNSLVETFYDDEIFLRHLLKEIKKGKVEGKSSSDFEIVLKSKRPGAKKDLTIDEAGQFEEKDTEVEST